MPDFKRKLTVRRICMLLLILAVLIPSLWLENLPKASAATSVFRGVNWADGRDNYVNGWVIPSGLTASETYSSASTIADRVISGFQTNLGANTVRMPINEPSVLESWWGVYTGAIDKALSMNMKVILGYWPWHNGKPDDMTRFNSMWRTVINKYGSNANVYFEIMNEPYGYSQTEWLNVAAGWLNTFSSVPKGRVLVSGTGYSDNVVPVGNDSRFNGCLLSQHIYWYWHTDKVTEQSWKDELVRRIGNYSSRTIVTEYGADMTTGINYNGPINGDARIAFMYGVPNKMRELGMGSVYWPGLRDDDTYSIQKRTGTGSNITLQTTNSSGRVQIRWAWGL